MAVEQTLYKNITNQKHEKPFVNNYTSIVNLLFSFKKQKHTNLLLIRLQKQTKLM